MIGTTKSFLRGRMLASAFATIAAGCAPNAAPGTAGSAPSALELTDPTRNRLIPVALYRSDGRRRPLVVLSPGYGNRNTEYAFIARELQRRGYLVAALQHDLEGDPMVPSGTDLAVRRRPFWEAGVANTRFVASELQRRGMAAPGRYLLVGHSHGGDIAMLHATLYPKELSAVFSLDNRRMPIPHTGRPRICSARSSDQTPDAGVLPSESVQASHKMIVVKLANQRHDDMWDGATAAQKDAMLAVLDRCLAGL